MLLSTEEVAPGLTKVNLRGRLDAAGARAIEGPFRKLARTQYDILVDLSRVTFIASHGLRVLISAARALAGHGGRMGVLRPDTAVEAVLISSGTDALIPVFGDLNEAIRGVCGAPSDGKTDAAVTRTFESRVSRDTEGVTRAGAWVDELATTLGLATRAEYALRLCLEESVSLVNTNTAPHPESDDPTILLRVVAEQDRLCLTIQDRGIGIDPLSPDRDAGELEPLGGNGFGAGLVRQYARDVTWSRLGETNRLTLTMPR